MERTQAMYYKVLNEDGSAFHGGSGKWFLPQGSRPGKWMPKIADPVPCERGYHILKEEHLVSWLGPAIFPAEPRGKTIWEADKGVTEQARLWPKLKTWNEQTARLFACDCAEAVVHLAKDERIVKAILVSRRFAFGLATKEELAAARAAARAAAEAAAEAAVWAAVWAAAWAAATAAAEAAAEAAAWAAQTKRLFQYLNGEVDLEEIRRRVTP